MVFLNISEEAEIHTISKTWRKCRLPLYGKSMGKHKHFKYMGFLNISGEAETDTVPKTWEKWISIVREKYGKTQTFQIYGFLKYFSWSISPHNSQNMGKVDSHSMGKVWENKHYKVMFLKYFGWSWNRYSSQNMGKVDFHSTGKVWENTNISNLWVS